MIYITTLATIICQVQGDSPTNKTYYSKNANIKDNSLSSQLLEEMDVSKLLGKRIGYYIGSFDPFHNGHKKLVDQILNQDLADYIIIYPVPGGDQYKNRSDFSIRKEMVRAVCGSNPAIITTNLTPLQMQAYLSPNFGQLEIIGVIGSDVVIEHLTDEDDAHKQKVSQIFMRGLKIPEKHSETTIGAIMALPATSFIVNIRNDSDLSHLNFMYEDRVIQSFIQLVPPYCYLSSTKVREAVRTNHPIDQMVDPAVEEIIKKYGLYTE
jgi:cytidyltransferase-like protein